MTKDEAKVNDMMHTVNGREYCKKSHNTNYNGRLGRFLLDNIKELNSCKTNEQLISLLSKSLTAVNERESNYVFTLINEVKAESSFQKNFIHVYDIVAAGEGMRVL